MKETRLKSRSLGASRSRFKAPHSSKITVMTAGAEEKPVLGHDAFMTSPIQQIEHWSKFGNWEEFNQEYPYTIGVDPGGPEGYKSGIVVFSGSKGENAFWYLDAGLEPLFVEGPHPFPKDAFEWHANETWWLMYARKEGIDITRCFPIFLA